METEKIIEEKNVMKEIVDFLKDLAIIVVVVKIITLFFVSVFIINGQSMYASYYDKEFILVDRFSTLQIREYKQQKVQRGDVIVFKPWVDEIKEYFIKRLIGMPWDSIKIAEWKVYLKKKWEKKFMILKEWYLNVDNNGNTEIAQSRNERIFVVPEKSYFVMGDNRKNSSDSRTCFSYSCKSTSRNNFIGTKDVVGKVLLDFWYFNIGSFSFTHPGTNKNPEIKWISTQPRWMNSPANYNY